MAGKSIPDRVSKKLSIPDGEPTDQPKARSMPMLSAVYKKSRDIQDMSKTLSAAIESKALLDQNKPIYDRCKDELTAACVGHSIPGFRHGHHAVVVNESPGRRTLNQGKLVTAMLNHGISVETMKEILEEATTEGEPFYTVKIIELVG